MIFQYDQLRAFFQTLNTLSSTSLFRDWQGESVFLLRHDVDFDIGLAHRLAEIEHEEGVVSTFFVLTTCESYNVACERNRGLLRDIVQMGHEIGLHFDPTLYGEDCHDAIRREADFLAFATDAEVCSVSLHNPSVHGQFPLFPGFRNAYDPGMFSDENYISDSCYSFRGKDPFKFIERVRETMVQILLHPMHYSEAGGGYDDVVVQSMIRHARNVHGNFLVNATYRQQMGQDIVPMLSESSRRPRHPTNGTLSSDAASPAAATRAE